MCSTHVLALDVLNKYTNGNTERDEYSLEASSYSPVP